MNWMNLPEKYSNASSYFKILPILYEDSPIYGAGASKGPSEIIKAAEQLEYYDEQFNNEPFKKGIQLLKSLNLIDCTPKQMIEKISQETSKHKDKFSISLGGDHATTIGTITGLEENHQEFSIIILDAHSDFRHSWNNSELNHACTSKQLSKNHDLLLLGIRSQDIEEAREIENNLNIYQINSYDCTKEKIKEILPKLKEKVFISIDVDVFDPSFIRNTGTPEPGGFQWQKIIEILKEIFAQREVIGADIVEFAPQENFRAEAYSLARLAYKIMALKTNSL